MKLNHILDNNISETKVDITTNESSIADFTYIENQLSSAVSNILAIDTESNNEVRLSDKEIIFFETYKRDVLVTTVDNKEFVIKMSIKKLEESLVNRRYFIKISKNTIINLEHVLEISYHSNMRFKIELSNKYKQFVNRNYFKDFKERVEEVYN